MSEKNVIQDDWAQREFVAKMHFGISKIVSFLNRFEAEARFKLAMVNEQLTRLERNCDFVEAILKHSDPVARGAKPSSIQGTVFDSDWRSREIQRKINRQTMAKPILKKISPSAPDKKIITLAPAVQEMKQPIPESKKEEKVDLPVAEKKSVEKAPKITSGGLRGGPPGAPPPGPPGTVPPGVPGSVPPGAPGATQQSGPPQAPAVGPPRVPAATIPPPIPQPGANIGGPPRQPPPGPGAPPTGPGVIPPSAPGQAMPGPGAPPSAPGAPPSAPGGGPPLAPGAAMRGPGAPPPGPGAPPSAPGPTMPGPGAPPPGPGAPPVAFPGPPMRPPPKPVSAVPAETGDVKDSEDEDEYSFEDPEIMEFNPPIPKDHDDVWIQRIKPGNMSKPAPTPTSHLIIEYTGWIMNTGDCFDQIDDFKFQMGSGDNIEGLEKILLKMREGEKILAYIPSQKAYGEEGGGDVIPPNSDLVFDLTLVSIE